MSFITVIVLFIILFSMLLVLSKKVTGQGEIQSVKLEKDADPTLLEKVTIGLQKVLPMSTPKFEKKCLQSGFSNSKVKAEIVIVLKIILPILFLYILMSYTNLQQRSDFFKLFQIVAVLLFGYFLPDIYLHFSIKRYRAKLVKGLNSVIDIVLICYEAGYSSEYVLERLNIDLKEFYPELAREFSITSNELKLLPDRRRAWFNLGERTGVEEIKVLTNSLQLSEQLGAGISYSLKNQIGVLRSKRLNKAEERASRIPEYMVGTNFFFMVLPVLLLVFSPLVLQILLQAGLIS